MAKEEHGVLLYYKFASITDLDALFSFYDSNCTSLGLLGRVRLSAHGVNVTVGGLLSSLAQHIAAVKSNSLFQGTDFKLASCLQPLDRKVAHECGFTSLSIRIVKELVTFSPHPSLKLPEVSSAGKHLSAVEFHSAIQNASGLMVDESHVNGEQVVLLDARNLYETRIGKFSVSTVKTLDPEIRQYSDLSSWIDNNAEQLRGKRILMYCTGGIRCEMASSYVRTKGAGFENVFQLFGGIQRYLEQFPDGGFFKGKNFVFDHRISVGCSETHVLGTCLLCKSPFDDYSSRCRCNKCRMLVLICDPCQVKDATYICELCQKHGHGEGTGTVIPVGDCKFTSIIGQNEFEAISSEAGFPSQLSPSDGKVTDYTLVNTLVPEFKPLSKRTTALREETTDLVEIKQTFGKAKTIAQSYRPGNGTSRKLRILCLHGFRQNGSSFKGRTASLAKKLKNIATLVFVNAAHELPFIYQHRSGQCGNNPSGVQHSSPPHASCNRKYAWLISPDFSCKDGIDWNVADHPFDRLQYQGQTDGFDVSLEYLKKVFHQEGPFDGILGFSQGAAMAALICAQRENLKIDIDFRFVILCSGYAVRTLGSVQGGIACPSLHVFGSDPSKDNQIGSEVSRNLASFFEQDSRVVVEHEFGHIIPTRSPYIDRLKGFLDRFR